jgi:hypothetical protein
MNSIDIAYHVGIFVGGIMAYGAKDLVKWYLQVKYDRVHKKVDRSRDVRVHELLSEIRIRLGAARAMVYQFHNGESFFTGEPFQKLATTHESVSLGVSESTMPRIDTPVSLMATVIDKTLDQPNQCQIVDDMPEHWCKHNLINLGVHEWRAVPMEVGRRLIGIVNLHFTKPCGMTDEDAKWFLSKVMQIEALLIKQ